MVLLFAIALGLTAILFAAVGARPPRARVTIGGALRGRQRVRLRRGASILVVNGDVRPHRLTQLSGPDAGLGDIRLERPGAACVLRFARRGTYTLRTHAGACLVPRLENEVAQRHATIEVVVR
jgi:hypothetical protein